MAHSAYRVVFKQNGKLQSWVRFYGSQDEADADAPVVVRREYPHAQLVAVLPTIDPRTRTQERGRTS